MVILLEKLKRMNVGKPGQVLVLDEEGELKFITPPETIKENELSIGIFYGDENEKIICSVTGK